MRDDFDLIANQVRTRTGLDIELCRESVRDSWRELLERNPQWSFLLKRGITTLPGPYSTGLATFTSGYDLVTGSGGAAWTPAMIGRQIRSAIGDPFYTITDVPSATALTITPSWADTTTSAISYSIFSAYLVPPDDFFSFVVVKDPLRSWRLNLDVDQSTIDFYDPKRSSTGQPLCLSPLDYAPSYTGKVSAALQATGTGSAPTSSGTYTGAADSIIFVQLTSTGAIDVATFQWKKGTAAWTNGGVVSSSGNILPEGIGLTWPIDGAFVNGALFAIRVTATSNPGLPRYEVYPYPSSQTILHYQYISRYPDLDDPNVTLPRYIPGNVLKEGALAKSARTPGSDEKPNPYAQIARAQNHEQRFDLMIDQLTQNDQEVFCRSIQYDIGLSFAPLPWAGMMGRPRDFDPPYIYPG